jgi:hypothetical protein
MIMILPVCALISTVFVVILDLAVLLLGVQFIYAIYNSDDFDTSQIDDVNESEEDSKTRMLIILILVIAFTSLICSGFIKVFQNLKSSMGEYLKFVDLKFR